MKKSLFAFTFLLLFTACGPADLALETEVPVEEPEAKVMAPQPFYIDGLSLNEDGTYRLTQQYVNWLSESEGSCRNMSSDPMGDLVLPVCNPNGFLLVESDSQVINEAFPANTPVYGINFGATANYADAVQEEDRVKLSMADLLAGFKENPDFFKVTPFELEYGTVTVDGVEMTDQITALKEIYLP